MRIRDSLVVALLLAASPASADEGGASFWLPGNFGSLAAVPSEPGWEMALVYYHSFGDQGADATFPRGGRVTAGVETHADFVFISPTYVFATPVAGAQASVNLSGAFGWLAVDIEATLGAPGGAAVSGVESDSRGGLADFYPMASLKWDHGVHDVMAYTMAGVPVGLYDVDRLANLGLNHWALDAGGGYTYFDESSELSAVLGFTYNFENPATDYRSGVDAHLDWAASRFFSPSLHAGLVGYFYGQLTGDHGAGAVLGDFKSTVTGLGPQAGWSFPWVGREWYANVKGYFEFEAKHRPEGWNAWLTLAFPLTGSSDGP